MEAVPGDVFGLERTIRAPLVNQFEVRLFQVAAGTVANRDPLRGDGVTVFQTAQRYLAGHESPSFFESLDGLWRAHAALRQPIQRVGPL